MTRVIHGLGHPSPPHIQFKTTKPLPPHPMAASSMKPSGCSVSMETIQHHCARKAKTVASRGALNCRVHPSTVKVEGSLLTSSALITETSTVAKGAVMDLVIRCTKQRMEH